MVSPYITAIQKVTGRTPGEKLQTLHRIAKNIIDNGDSVNGIFEVQPSEELPELLIPIVKLEIALMLKQPGGIIDALKSEDKTIFHRALKAKWFFDGSIENYPDAIHFRDNICLAISVKHRLKIIKVLANNLAVKKLTSTAEEFYNVISKSYDHHQARRLLKACSEPFIANIIENQKIKLSLGEVKYFFAKYPQMITEYLKSQKNFKQPYRLGTFGDDYLLFLPKLLKKHSHRFVEIIQAHDHVNLKLRSRHHIELFMKNQLDALITNPKVFLCMLPKKKVIQKLTPQQIEKVVKVYFPETLEKFDFGEIYGEIFTYLPRDLVMTTMISYFEDIYKESLLNYPDKLTIQAMRLLPRDKRIEQARKKLELNDEWYLFGGGYNTMCSWRCYLPIEESIPLIKGKIKECENSEERLSLITQLIYTCSINDDKDALLDVLKYIIARHRNEKEWIWSKIFERLEMDFQLQLLSSEHWNILSDILNHLNNPSNNYNLIFECWSIIAKKIHFKLINNQPISDEIKLMIHLNANNTALNKWNLIEEVPEYEKKCLEEFLRLLPTELSEERKDQNYKWKTSVLELVKAIYIFNNRQCPKDENQFQKILVKNYSWLVDAIKNILNALDQASNEFYINELKSTLELNEPELLTETQPSSSKKKVLINLKKAVVILHRQPERIFKNWLKYYKKCVKESGQYHTLQFLRACCWYQDLPIKFFDQAIDDYLNNQVEEALIIASAFLDGPSFELFITPYLPEINPNIDTFLDKDDPVLSSIEKCLKNLYAPVPFDFVIQFCIHDYVHCILNYLLCLGQRTPVSQLLTFCDQLTDRAVSVRKHLPRIVRTAANSEQLCTCLISFWRREKHKSVRLIIEKYMIDYFFLNPSPESWRNMSECLDGLETTEKNIIDVPIRNIEKVPANYMADYVRKLIQVFERIGDLKQGIYPYGVFHYILSLFQAIMPDVAKSFPEELHKELLEKYLLDSTAPKEVLGVLRKYLVLIYIKEAGDQLDDRLEFFSNIFTRIVKDKWDEPVDENASFCPANYFVHQLTENIIYKMEYSPIKSKLIDTALKTFLTLLQPQQEPEFYCTFSFASLYNDKTTWEEFTLKVHQHLPSVVNIFSAEFMYYIARFLHKLINLLYSDKLQLQIIERLLDFNNDNTYSLAAALLLNEKHNSNDERFWKIFRALRKYRHPLVASSAYLAVHSINNYAS